MENKIGEMISRSRQNLKMTQEELASRLGVTTQAVSHWERGRGLPDISMVPGLCEILHLSADALLGIPGRSVVENGDYAMDREIRGNLFSDPIAVEFGKGLVPSVAEGLKTNYVNRKREELAKQTGMLLPILRIRDNLELPERMACVLSYDKVMFKKTYETDEDIWKDIIDQTVEICRAHYGEILNKQTVKVMVDTVKELYPGAADGLIPEKISYLETLQFLRKKLAENGSLRNMLQLLEELEETAQEGR